LVDLKMKGAESSEGTKQKCETFKKTKRRNEGKEKAQPVTSLAKKATGKGVTGEERKKKQVEGRN